MTPEEYEQKMLRDIELRQKGLRDQYNSSNNEFCEDDYQRVLKADLNYSPSKNELYVSYFEKLQIYVKLCTKKNIKTHILSPKGAWYTHRNPQGCFACEDLNLMSVMLNVIGMMASKSPQGTF